VGIDKKAGGALAPIFEDGSFEYIPIPEDSVYDSAVNRTYSNTIGRKGKPLSTYLPNKIKDRTIHFDPEFETCTYGDPTRKRIYLLKLEKGDLLVFYSGLTPFNNIVQPEGCYMIGYFTVKEIIDFNELSETDRQQYCELYYDTAHFKRSEDTEDLVMVIGNKNASNLLEKAILIRKALSGSIKVDGRTAGNLRINSKKHSAKTYRRRTQHIQPKKDTKN
jgi:hypothetical protein